MATSPADELLICTTCGTQFEEKDPQILTSCRICDDPRQFLPPTGQSFTTLGALKSSTTPKYTNKHKPLDADERFISLWTEPKVGIGQRAILIKTATGNVLWDCITFLDDETVTWIESQGGLEAIVISHPHFYSTHVEWAKKFHCHVYVSGEDEKWLNRRYEAVAEGQTLVGVVDFYIYETGVRVLKLGGHFPGSLVCLYEGRLLVADTLMTTPAGTGNWKDKPRPKGMNSFAFMWSIPNLIPLGPDEMAKMWSLLKTYAFRSTHGAFVGSDIFAGDVKGRVLESMKIQCKSSGHGSHAILNETWEGM